MVARAKPEMSGGPSFRSSGGTETPVGSTVVPGEPSIKSPQGVRLATTSPRGISSAVQTRGSVLELASKIKGIPVRVLLDSGATGNFISDNVVTELALHIDHEEAGEQLTLADGSQVQASGHVTFPLRCGYYKGKITARVFPNLHKELILGIPWLTTENPDIDWTRGKFTV